MDKQFFADRFGKYKGIIVSIALFLLLDASVLIMNFYISFEIADDASAVNLAGRQRMLSQRITKSLYDIELSENDIESYSKALDELSLTASLFDNTLMAFKNGGQVKGADGNAVTILAVKDETGLSAIDETIQTWTIYLGLIQQVLNVANVNALDDSTLQTAINYGKSHNLALLKNMNTLTVQLENIASSKATTLRLIQTVGISLAILNFFIIMSHFLRQLRESDIAIESARRETTEILETVNEGLFLVDRRLHLGTQHSKELNAILGRDDIAGSNFGDLLHSMVSEKDLKSSEGFIELLFNPKIKEKLIRDLNPLDEIQVNIQSKQGTFDTKYLSFDFARVIEEGEIINVLVSVNDITENVLLARELERLKDKENTQLEMLTSILHTNHTTLKAFIENALSTFNSINDQLKTQSRTGHELNEKVAYIFRAIHTFKGEAGALQLDKFAEMADDFEDELQFLRSKDALSGNDFLTLTLKLEELFTYTHSVNSLIEKMSGFGNTEIQEKTVSVNTQLHSYLEDLCNKTGKKAQLYCSGLNEYSLDTELENLINDITIQFLRNSVAHGIETSEERNASQKPAIARIDCHLSHNIDGSVELIFEDDGDGINYNAIRQKAMDSGIWSPQEIEQWNNKKLLSLIFTPGFSTINESNTIAGRGVGMDIIKEKIQAAKGKLQIKSRKGIGTRFVVTLPDSQTPLLMN